MLRAYSYKVLQLRVPIRSGEPLCTTLVVSEARKLSVSFLSMVVTSILPIHRYEMEHFEETGEGGGGGEGGYSTLPEPTSHFNSPFNRVTHRCTSLQVAASKTSLDFSLKVPLWLP